MKYKLKKRSKKQLVYWNGEEIIEFKKIKEKIIDGSNYLIAKMRKGDPPIGWTL